MAGPGAKHSLAWWREAREWWHTESPREFHTYTDENGVRRESEKVLPRLVEPSSQGQKPLDDKHNEEWDLKLSKTRDEKVAAATNQLSEHYYERASQERRLQAAMKDTAWAVVTGTGSGRKRSTTGYVPLHVFSGYSFGRSTMLADEIAPLVATAGCGAVVIADHYSLSGAVEHVRACASMGIKPLIGATIGLPEGGEIVLIARTKRGYQNLSQLITECHLKEPRRYPLGSWERLERFSADLVCLTGGDMGPIDRALIAGHTDLARRTLERLIAIYGREDTFVEVERSFLPWMLSVGRNLLELARTLNLTPVAGGAITHARPEHFPAQDSLVCAHTLCTIEEVIGRKEPRDSSQPQAPRFPDRALNAERYIRSVSEMQKLYGDRPELLENTLRVAERCDASVLPDRTVLPQLFPDDSKALRDIVAMHAPMVYGKLTGKHRARLSIELERVTKLGYATHFLVAWDFCRWSREQGIQMSGRGSIVDSALAHVLGFSRIDAIKHNLHFDRFLPADGSKRPDIDIDFEAKRRDDIKGYLNAKYGVENVASVCAISTYRTRGIIRDISKVMGLPEETISFITKRIHGGIPADQFEAALAGRPELRDSNISKEKFRWVIELAERLKDVPNGIGTHSCGVVVSNRPIAETVPVMWSGTPGNKESRSDDLNMRMIQWDKRSAKACFDKFDILCLRGQDVLSGVESRVRTREPDFSAERMDSTTNPEVYRAMRSGELIGVPQSASPAMRQAHVRLGTANLHDASLVQAGIRPGVGGAVKLNELIARRRGKPYTFNDPKLEQILGNTYGIIVFQEQVDQLLQTFCGYSGGEAEDIRDAIHKRRRDNWGEMIGEKLIGAMRERGYGLELAKEVLDYIAGFKGYGFAQGHALSFAEVSLRSVENMQDRPSVYFASLLSAQPAGYYGSATIANEARNRGVRILGIDVNKSKGTFEPEDVQDDNGMLVPWGGIRTGLMQLSGLADRTKERILEYQLAVAISEPVPDREPLPSVKRQRGRGRVATLERMEDPAPPPIKAFRGFYDFVAKVQPDRDDLERLILSGALDSLCSNRRALLWAIPQAQEFAKIAAYRPGELPFDYPEPDLDLTIPDFTVGQRRIYERSLLDMDIDIHLLSFERDRVKAKGGITGREAQTLSPGDTAFVVGNPIRLRFPPTQSGKRVVFFDLEDETGLLNVTCFDDVYMRYGHAIVTSPYVTVMGEFQDRDGYPAFLAQRVYAYKSNLGKEQLPLPLTVGDFLVS